MEMNKFEYALQFCDTYDTDKPIGKFWEVVKESLRESSDRLKSNDYQKLLNQSQFDYNWKVDNQK